MKKLKSQIIAKANEVNKNNRLYPKSVLEKIVNDFNVMEKCTMIGEFGSVSDTVIRFSNCSHMVDSLQLSENGELIADISILDTPNGKILSKMIDENSIDFALKGIGTTKFVNGVNVVEDDYKIISISAVSNKI